MVVLAANVAESIVGLALVGGVGSFIWFLWLTAGGEARVDAALKRWTAIVDGLRRSSIAPSSPASSQENAPTPRKAPELAADLAPQESPSPKTDQWQEAVDEARSVTQALANQIESAREASHSLERSLTATSNLQPMLANIKGVIADGSEKFRFLDASAKAMLDSVENRFDGGVARLDGALDRLDQVIAASTGKRVEEVSADDRRAYLLANMRDWLRSAGSRYLQPQSLTTPDSILDDWLAFRRRPTVIAVVNHKGGVGKTTLTAILGSELKLRGLNVLAIDLDGQGTLSRTLAGNSIDASGLSVNRMLADLLLAEDQTSAMGSFANMSPMDAYAHLESPWGQQAQDAAHFQLLPTLAGEAPKRGVSGAHSSTSAHSSTETNGVAFPGREFLTPTHRLEALYASRMALDPEFERRCVLFDALNRHRWFMKNDVVLIDCSPGFSLIADNGLAFADGIVVPLHHDAVAVEGFGKVMDHLQALGNVRGHAPELVAVVENMKDGRSSGSVFTDVTHAEIGAAAKVTLPKRRDVANILAGTETPGNNLTDVRSAVDELTDAVLCFHRECRSRNGN